jgi:hypothetical protein
MWLVLNNKLFTWEIRRRRGWFGPSICVLCMKVEESSSYLFSHCDYPRHVVVLISQELNTSNCWDPIELEDNLKKWLENRSLKNLEALPCILVNSILWA